MNNAPIPFSRLRFLFVYLVSISLIYAPMARGEQLALPSTDLEAPQVMYEPDEQTMDAGRDKKFRAIVTDNVGVKSVTLFYRTKGTKEYKRKLMARDSGDTYITVLDADQVKPPGIEYYIQATDTSGNNLLHGYSFSPLVINVTPGAPATDESSDQLAYSGDDDGSSNKWLWIGLGVLAVAAAAGGGSSGGGGSNDGTVVVSAPLP